MINLDSIFGFVDNLRRLVLMQPEVAVVQADMFVMLATMMLSFVLSYALQPKPAVPKPAAFEDFDFAQSTEGTAQAVIFGDVWIEGWTVIGVGNYRTTPIIK